MPQILLSITYITDYMILLFYIIIIIYNYSEIDFFFYLLDHLFNNWFRHQRAFIEI